ncbi:MAG: hypothetical protein QNK25_08715 [Desulfobacterales bacterium]|nr:hypothetical protein [Desulfobacterales bacterium]
MMGIQRKFILPIYLLHIFVIYLFLTQNNTIHAAHINHIGIDQRVLVICVLWDEHATTRLASCDDWATLLNNEIDTFYDQSTFGETTFQFDAPIGAPNNGWLSLGYNSSDYDFFKTGQDAIDLADPYVDFSDYHRVTVITNHPNFRGQGISYASWVTDEGMEVQYIEDGNTVDKRIMSLSVVNEWAANLSGLPYDEAAAVVAHELGHHLDVKTHYGSLNWFPGTSRGVMTPWGVMGLSPHKNHFLGWAKLERQWIPGSRTQIVNSPTTADIDTTITLSPNETGSGTQLIKVPISTGAVFAGYVIENRQLINGDENLPSSGILLSFVDESPNTILKAIVLDDPDSPGDLNQAALEIGDSYTDSERNLTITYVSQSGDDADVRVEYLLPPALPSNPQITPWGAPPWETVDIWIDSEKNGWGTYRYTDGSGNPVGNGDDTWVDHDNRVYFRISNAGDGDASNVRVQVYANHPPGMGDRGADWRYLGTAIFPNIGAHTSEIGYVTWKTDVGEHTCLKVIIVESELESYTLDNIAQENVTAFDTSASSPYRAQCMRFTVNNPFENKATPVHFLMKDIPKGWKAQLEPSSMVLPSGGTDQVCIIISPPFPNDEYAPGYIGKTKLEALIPYANTFIPIGGIDIWTHLTKSSRLILNCNASSGSGRRILVDLDTQTDGASDGLASPEPGEITIDPVTADKAISLFSTGALVGPELESSSIGPGESITITGQLFPGFSGATIAVDFTTDGQIETKLTTTNPDGSWSVSHDPAIGGLYEVKAYFAGDAEHAAAESNRCRFDVERTKINQKEEEVCNPQVIKLINLLIFVLPVVALILFIVAYRKRMCWLALIAAILTALMTFLFLLCRQTFLPHSIIFFLLTLFLLYWWFRCRSSKDITGITG